MTPLKMLVSISVSILTATQRQDDNKRDGSKETHFQKNIAITFEIMSESTSLPKSVANPRWQ